MSHAADHPAPEPCLLLVRTIASRQVVVRGCPAAGAAGVRPGMTLTEARALIGGGDRASKSNPHPHPDTPPDGPMVTCVEHDPRADRAALERLAGWATTYLPSVAPEVHDPTGDAADCAFGLLADITGCERLYHGEANLLTAVREALARLGFPARLAAAPTFGCAWAVARFGPETMTVVQPGQEREVLANLPVAGLRLDAKTEEALEPLAVNTIGQLLDLPRRALPSRFGEGLTLRLDQALGRAMEMIEPVRPRPPVRQQRDFDGPVKQPEAIAQAARGLIEGLCHTLTQRGSGARAVRLVLERSDCEPVTLTLTLSRFTREPGHLWTLLRPKLERAHLGYGVVSMTLTAERVGLLAHRQTTHDWRDGTTTGDHDPAELDRQSAETLDILINRLGSRAVCRAEVVGAHQPERTWRYIPLSESGDASDSSPGSGPTRSAAARLDDGAAMDVPPVLLPRPREVAVTALMPDGPLVAMRWEGRVLQLRSCLGPRRITPAWWRSDGLSDQTRDYFKVQDECGRWWWLYRESDRRRWFLHGGWA